MKASVCCFGASKGQVMGWSQERHQDLWVPKAERCQGSDGGQEKFINFCYNSRCSSKLRQLSQVLNKWIAEKFGDYMVLSPLDSHMKNKCRSHTIGKFNSTWSF